MKNVHDETYKLNDAIRLLRTACFHIDDKMCICSNVFSDIIRQMQMLRRHTIETLVCVLSSACTSVKTGQNNNKNKKQKNESANRHINE